MMGFLGKGFFLIHSGCPPDTNNLAVLAFEENFESFFVVRKSQDICSFSVKKVETYICGVKQNICF